MNLNPSGLVNAVKQTASAVAQAPAAAVEAVKETATAVETKVGQAADQVTSSIADPFTLDLPDLGDLAETVKGLPGAAGTAIKETALGWLPDRVEGHLPPYPTLDPAEKAAAAQRGQGLSVPTGSISSDPAGARVNEPVTMVVTGSRADIEAALKSQGWVQASGNNAKVLSPDAPVSPQYLNGQVQEIAFNKNSDHNKGRDHLRVYSMGPDPATGEERWAIAATRDTAFLSDKHGIGHDTDKNTDGERDLIMHDLLASGLVKDWAVVAGDRPAGHEATTDPDGRTRLGEYTTDGGVYAVRVGR